MDSTLTFLWGPGARVELIDFGDGDRPAVVYDITRIARFLASYGLTCPRTVCLPSTVDGYVTVTQGAGGRALWIDGGGDVDAAAVSWAIAAAHARPVVSRSSRQRSRTSTSEMPFAASTRSSRR